jgi:hypothetical protein
MKAGTLNNILRWFCLRLVRDIDNDTHETLALSLCVCSPWAFYRPGPYRRPFTLVCVTFCRVDKLRRDK